MITDQKMSYFYLPSFPVTSQTLLAFIFPTEWIGNLSSDVPVVVMDLTRILCFGGGVSEFTLNHRDHLTWRFSQVFP